MQYDIYKQDITGLLVFLPLQYLSTYPTYHVIRFGCIFIIAMHPKVDPLSQIDGCVIQFNGNIDVYANIYYTIPLSTAQNTLGRMTNICFSHYQFR